MSSSWLFIILTFISIKSFSLFIAAYQEHESDPLSDFEHNVISDEDTESLTGYVNIRGSLSQWHYQDLFGGRAGGGCKSHNSRGSVNKLSTRFPGKRCLNRFATFRIIIIETFRLIII